LTVGPSTAVGQETIERHPYFVHGGGITLPKEEERAGTRGGSEDVRREKER